MGKCLFTYGIIYRYFLICSVILSLKLLESKKEGTMANVDERKILLGAVAEYEQKPGSVKLCS